MWTCEACGNINPSDAASCLNCRRARTNPGLTGPAPTEIDPAPPALGEDMAGPSRAAIGPASSWFVWRLAMMRQPMVVLCLAALLIVELVPVCVYRLWAVVPAVLSFLLIKSAIVEVWKRGYLEAQGSRALGTVIRISTTTINGRRWSNATLRYGANGNEYTIRDDAGGYAETYVQQGDKIGVIYDPSAPNVAKLDNPEANNPRALVIWTILGLFCYWLAWTLHIVTSDPGAYEDQQSNVILGSIPWLRGLIG